MFSSIRTAGPQFLSALTNFQIVSPYSADDLSTWARAFWRWNVLIECVVLLVCFAVGLLITKLWLRHALSEHSSRRKEQFQSFWLGARGPDGVFFPLLLLVCTHIARAIISTQFQPLLLTLALSVLIILLVLRVVVSVIILALPEAKWPHFLENLVGWGAWIGGILWVIGLLPALWTELDELSWKMGSSTVSIATLLQGLAVAMVVMLLMLWLSGVVERKLLRDAPTGAELSLRKAISNATRALLLFMGVLLAFSSAGIDLTALSVLGGAVGVGIGLGLQRVAANYVSGFVILTERSIRIGDVVKTCGVEGKVTQINTRYTVIRSTSGRETLVPNDMLVTSTVESMSFTDNLYQLSFPLAVRYGNDPDIVRAVLLEILQAHPLVMKKPEPSVDLTSLEDIGMRFTLYYWFEVGKGNSDPKSDLNFAILRTFRERGIEIAYPIREVHVSGTSNPLNVAVDGA